MLGERDSHVFVDVVFDQAGLGCEAAAHKRWGGEVS